MMMLQRMISRYWQWAERRFWYRKQRMGTDNVPAAAFPLTKNVRERTAKTSSLHAQVKKILFQKYDFRFNVLTEQVELRGKGNGAHPAFRRVDQRTLNTMVIELQEQGLTCWNQDVERLLKSNYVETYHPFTAYMEALPQWDGVDRILPLALRIDDSTVWINGFRRWLLALAAQWMGKAERCANTLIPVLVSPKQGLAKSSFCRLLMPPVLRDYYLDKFDFNAKANAEMKLATFGLINLDEFDRYSSTALATLKNLVQLKQLSVKKAYASYYLSLRRIASFIGTSNQTDLLNDPTGSRRFLCVEVRDKIDCSAVDHAQLFAQLKYLVENGERVWMDAQEEMELQAHNQVFSRLHPEEEVFYELYDIPQKQTLAQLVAVTEIHRNLSRHHPGAMRGISVQQLGRTLSAMGLKKEHTNKGNKYYVMMREGKPAGT